MASSSGARCAGLSGTGFKFGMAHTSLYPPRAAARVPGGDGLFIKKSRFPKMYMHIHKTRQ